MKSHNGVSATAFLTSFWKDESRRETNRKYICVAPGGRKNDLFKDDFMTLFVDEEVKREGLRRLPKKMWLPLATRCRFFRQAIAKQVKAGEVKQVILLGGGFDTLAVRKNQYSTKYNIKFFEVDQPDILRYKRDVYIRNNINKNATYIGIDYVQSDLIASLRDAGVDFTQPTVILWEGNTFYLEKSQVLDVLRQLSVAFEKLTINVDFMHPPMSEKTRQLDEKGGEKSLETTLSNFEAAQSPFKSFFSPDEMRKIFREFGMECTDGDMKTAAALAIEYDVDTTPYYTAEPYSVATFHKR